jgi:hypothetical protein
MFTPNYIFDCFHLIYDTGMQHALMLATIYKRPASLHEVLQLAGLLQGYKDFLNLKNEAEVFFLAGNFRAAFNTIGKMWVHPRIVPALVLIECFETRELIVPNWYQNMKLYRQDIQKKDGGVRPIIIADKRLRVCMSVINRLLQCCCVSWSSNSFGFRPGFGTQDAVSHLAQKAQSVLSNHKQAVIVSFDLKAAFNSVDAKHLMQTLQLGSLPGDMKKLIWMWQHLPIAQDDISVTGLAQGYAYSPTLFAWYVDKLLGQHMDVTIYADNVTGVFYTKQDAILAVKKAQTLLHNSGLQIAPNSIQMHWLHHSRDYVFRWLGHSVVFPSGTVKTHKHEIPVQSDTHQVWTLAKWDSMLSTVGWVQIVLNAKWRRF